MFGSAVDVTGTFLATKFAMTQFLKQDEDKHGFRGNIINISSIAGSSGLPGCCESFVTSFRKQPRL
jgi:NAD(P)-dependent dehydrogenase (short-subunit alcohol dehydrogenase family)